MPTCTVGDLLSIKDLDGDVPQTWVAESAFWYISDSLFYAKFGI